MQARRIFFVLSVVVSIVMPHARLEACAVCLTGVAGGDRLAEALNWSVLFLMGAPYVIFGAVVGWLFYIHRSSVREEERIRRKPSMLRLAWVNKRSGR